MQQSIQEQGQAFVNKPTYIDSKTEYFGKFSKSRSSTILDTYVKNIRSNSSSKPTSGN